MRTHKGLYALIALTFILQACGNAGATPAGPPTVTETLPVVTVPPVTELPVTALPAGEFFASIPFRSGLGFRGPWLELYFIDPTSPFAQREVGSVDDIVSASITAAKQSVDVAVRSMSLDNITKALMTAARRGVAVRVITETDSLMARSNFQTLRDAGIPVIDDQQPGLMNNKFIVIDHAQVWTGSVDYNISGVFREYNSLVRVSSPEMAADYTKEFDEMFVNNQFGRLVVPETPYPSVSIQGTQVDVMFSPDDIVVDRLSKLLGEAEQSIYFLAYSFGSNDLGNVIREKASQGIAVGGVLESDQVTSEQANPNQVDELNRFRQAGVDIRLDGQPEVMNHKIMIIDGRIVIMGSYDFTNRAENENDENVLIIYNEKIAEKFMEEFQRVQSRAQQ
jgi:phosphatidylserine/phosphatidylglycerophosphate/cardiolipin synthase-like enzyme